MFVNKDILDIRGHARPYIRIIYQLAYGEANGTTKSHQRPELVHFHMESSGHSLA